MRHGVPEIEMSNDLNFSAMAHSDKQISRQEPITRSEHLPYLLLELSFLQTELFLERLSRQANNAFVY